MGELMSGLERGCVQIYTGDGKGKTTAALGLSLRAMGHGLDVLFLQFAKKYYCSEHLEAARIGLEIAQGTEGTPADCTRQIMGIAHWALQPSTQVPIASIELRPRTRPVDMLVLDELGEAMRRGYIGRSDIEELIAIKPKTTELVLTGRGLICLADLADLVTEMRPIKHYFDQGLLARKGIEY